jgi:hypothetical protein
MLWAQNIKKNDLSEKFLASFLNRLIELPNAKSSNIIKLSFKLPLNTEKLSIEPKGNDQVLKIDRHAKSEIDLNHISVVQVNDYYVVLSNIQLIL